MTVYEFFILDGLRIVEDAGSPATARTVGAECGKTPRRTGYTLRALARRGLVVTVGRRHGGAHKWSVTAAGASVLNA